MKIEAHLGANYDRNGRYEFEKSYYSNKNKGFGQHYLWIEINYIYTCIWTQLKSYTVLFPIFMEVEEHLAANYGKNSIF